jgi:arylsulfatase
MATFVEVAGAKHPTTYHGRTILPLEGESLLPVFEGRERHDRSPIFWEHEGNRAVRLDKWKLVSRYPRPWELYDMNKDRTELHDVASEQPALVKGLAQQYERWAVRCGVVPPNQLPSPKTIIPANTKDPE